MIEIETIQISNTEITQIIDHKTILTKDHIIFTRIIDTLIKPEIDITNIKINQETNFNHHIDIFHSFQTKPKIQK